MDNHSSLNSSINITQSSNALYEATFGDELNTDDVAELTEIWINERNCPEILPYKKRLIEDLMELIEHQASISLQVYGSFHLVLI
jgi:GINS complex subunit 4